MSLYFESIQAPPPGQCFRLLRWKDNLQEVEGCEPFGKIVPLLGAGEQWHLHEELELTWIETGRGTRVVGDSIAPFRGPELVLLGSNLPHCWHGLRHSKGLALQFRWGPEHPARALPEFSSLLSLWERSGRGILFPPPVAERVALWMAQMIEGSPALRLGLLWQIFAELASLPSFQIVLLSEQDFGLPHQSRHQHGIQRVIEHTLAHYANPFSMAHILQIAAMSKSTFARQFPRFTGHTYTTFLNRIRLDHARHAILTTHQSVSSIAFAVGFEHLSHFNRAYRERFGLAPTHDRRATLSPLQ